MKTLVFDIETVGLPLESFDELTQHRLVEPQKPEETEDLYAERMARTIDNFSFSPFTAEIVAIACSEVESGWCGAYYQAGGAEAKETAENGETYVATSEKAILQYFWAMAEKCDQFVTFNGRRFDVPFLLLRSAIHGIRPGKNLGKARYLYQMDRNAVHIDLCDQLTLYGAFGGKYMGLHMACQAFGIKSPKEGGMDGSQVGEAYAQGRYKEIAEYCLADVIATTELYKRWDELLRF